MVEGGEFRSDLYFRLEVFPIELPPLRDRPTDIALIAQQLLTRICKRHGRTTHRLTDGAAKLLEKQLWPGNVRQLSNVLERAVILSDGESIGLPDLKPLLEVGGADQEEAQLRQALVQTDGDKRAAAEILGLSYRTLQRKIKEHDLEGFPKYRS